MKVNKEEIKEFYKEMLGYYPKETDLKIIPDKFFKSFCDKNGLDKTSKGVFLTRTRSALINEEVENKELSLFHEYFGHGLYSEQTQLGRCLYDLEQLLLQEEQDYFKQKTVTLEGLKKFRETNENAKYLEELKNQNLKVIEQFAIYTEYFLANKFGLSSEFEQKYPNVAKSNQLEMDKIITFNSQYGDLATFYSFNLSRNTRPKRVKKLLEELYKGGIKDLKFASLYGSKKEFSDIDIFAITDNSNCEIFENNWIDTRIYEEKEFEERLSLFDVSVTDPLFKGEYILGNFDLFSKKKKQLFDQPITQKAIDYNFSKSNEQSNYASSYPKKSKDYYNGLTYSLTYLKNALALREGKRILTKEGLLNYNPNKAKGGEI